eukprot:SAG22_NODE_12553_length_438_cov_0.914454_1_plen_58_part_10
MHPRVFVGLEACLARLADRAPHTAFRTPLDRNELDSILAAARLCTTHSDARVQRQRQD